MRLGWSLSEAIDALLSYRLDSYKVFNTGTNVDPAFRAAAGRTEVTALGVGVEHDTRDESAYPTAGFGPGSARNWPANGWAGSTIWPGSTAP